jgi:hypothetical protein
MSAYYSDSFTDYADRILSVRWSEEVWVGHLQKHPQLRDTANASLMIRSTVEEPSVVLEGTRPGDSEFTVVYYREVSRHQHFATCIKVVCGVNGKRRYVKTVFEETAPFDLVIQEKRYPQDFKEICRNQTNIL